MAILTYMQNQIIRITLYTIICSRKEQNSVNVDEWEIILKNHFISNKCNIL